MSVTDAARHGSKQVIYENYPELGFNYRMTDMQAAVGRVQLRRLPDIVSRRRQIADQYREQLAELPGFTPPAEPSWARTNWQSYCVKLPDWIDQRATMQALLDQGISTRRGIMNIHREAAYAEPDTCRIPGRLHNSLAAQQQAIILPLYLQMTDNDVSRVVDALRTCSRAAAGRPAA